MKTTNIDPEIYNMLVDLSNMSLLVYSEDRSIQNKNTAIKAQARILFYLSSGTTLF